MTSIPNKYRASRKRDQVATAGNHRTSSPRVVLTADRSLMSDFRGNYILGFLSCAPSDFIPDIVYDRLFAPTVDSNPDGTAVKAPMGLRRIESALLEDENYGPGSVAIAHPDHLEKVVGRGTDVIGVNAMDPLGKGPVTSSFTHDTDRTPMNAVKFTELMEAIEALPSDQRVVVGGGGSWQLTNADVRSRYRVEHIVQGEASHDAARLFDEIRTGDADELLFCDSPDGWDDIPEIQGATVNAIVEAMRGCGRGCDFCGPDMRRNLYPPVERLTREAKVNTAAGFDYIWMHSEDILLYDFEGRFEPNHEAITELYRELLAVDGITKVGATHMSLAAICRDPELIEELASLNGLGPKTWTGVQPGIETASPKLVEQHIGGKPAPYDVSEWPTVVERAIRILNDNYYYPACTLIVGLPGETDEDVQYTIDLVEDIDDTHSILAPLMYMDYASGNTLTAGDMSPKQWELFYKCWKHNTSEIADKTWRATRGWNPASRVVSQGLAWITARSIMRGLDRVRPTPVSSGHVA